jgi:hypothetical protein
MAITPIPGPITSDEHMRQLQSVFSRLVYAGQVFTFVCAGLILLGWVYHSIFG